MGEVISMVGRRGRGVDAAASEAPAGDLAAVLAFPREAAAPPPDVAGARPRTGTTPRPTFFVDPACPATYLAAERVERTVAGARWIACPPLGPAAPLDRARLEARAGALGLPLRWPDDGAGEGTPLRRLAVLAEDDRAVQTLTIAAGRLAFCGGYDLDAPDVLAELAAHAGLPHALVGRALAGDAAADRLLTAAGAAARLLGADRLPALQVRRRLFAGEERLPEALACLRAVTHDRAVGPR